MRKQRLFTTLFAIIIAATLVLANQTAAQTIWAVGNTEKITPKEPVSNSNYVWSSPEKLVSIKAARNEHEPFQLVITADSGPLYRVNVSVSDLTSGGNTIASDNITLYRETFLNVTRKSQYWAHPILGIIRVTPDALVPFKDPYGSTATPGVPFDVPSGENQPVWVDVYVPSDTIAGHYIGAITVKERAATIDTITLVVDVWDFEIPVQRHLKYVVYDFPADIEGLYYEVYGVKDIPDAVMENHYQALADRRLGALRIHKRPTYDEATGFDWTDIEPLYDRLMDVYNFPVLSMPPIYYDARVEEDGEIWWEEQYAINDPSGLPYTTADFTEGSDFVAKATKYYQRLYDDFNAKGWIGKHFAELNDESGHVSDEPYNIGQEGYRRVRLWSDILHSANSNIRFLLAGDSIIPSAAYDDVRGYVDIWDMYMDEIQLNAPAYQAHLAANLDEELWMVPNAYADFVDYPAIYHRTLGWFAYKYGATGIELWSVYAWLDANQEYYDPWKAASPPDAHFGLGAGALFYPGYNIENRGINIQGPVTSIRLELNRETIEDYEYLWLLEQQIGSGFPKSLADKIIPSQLFYGIATQPEDFYAAREAIGDILSRGMPVSTATISGLVKDSHSVPITGALVSTDGAAGITDSDGAYSIIVIPGTYTVKASVYQHLSSTQTITVKPDELRTDIDFVLTPVSRESVLLFNSFENVADIWTDAEGAVTERSSAYATDGSYSMKVTFDESLQDSYLGVEYESPQNWAIYTSLKFDIYNDSPYRSLLDIIIYDSNWETVFKREELSLSPETWGHIKIPIDTSFDEVLAVELYIDNYGKGDRDIYIDNICLTIDERRAGVSATFKMVAEIENNQVVVKVLAEEVFSLLGFSLKLSYSSELELHQIKPGDFRKENFQSTDGNPVEFSAHMNDEANVVNKEGTIAILRFKIWESGRMRFNLSGEISGIREVKESPNFSKCEITVVASPNWDMNKDYVVDIFDLVALGKCFGQEITGSPRPNPDVNRDGIVNIFDLVGVGTHFGERYSAVHSAPLLVVKKWNNRKISPEQLPILLKIYEKLEKYPMTSEEYYRTKELLLKLIEIASGRIVPPKTKLLANYPNPFNPDTWIPFHLSKSANVIISIYDIGGQLIYKIGLGKMPAGVYVSKDRAVYWNGCNNTGEKVASGVYFYHLQAGSYSATKRMLIVK